MGRKHEVSDNEITVTTLNGVSLTVSRCRHMRVADLKRKVQMELDMPDHEQCVVWHGRQVCDDFEFPAGTVEVIVVLVKHHEDFSRWLDTARRDPRELANAPRDILNDRHFFLEHFRSSRLTAVLDFASEEVLADRKVIHTAVCRNPYALEYASPLLDNYEKLVLLAISGAFPKQIRDILVFAAPQMQLCEAVALQAVSKDGLALGKFSEQIRMNRKIVRAAVKNNGLALQYASSSLLSNLEVVSAACAQCAEALKYADPSMRNISGLFSQIARRNGCALEFASDELRADPEVVTLAAEKNAVALVHAADGLQNDSQFQIRLLRINGMVLDHVRADMFNLDMIEAAMVWALQWVSAGKSWYMIPARLRCRPELIEACLNKSKTGTLWTLQLARDARRS